MEEYVFRYTKGFPECLEYHDKPEWPDDPVWDEHKKVRYYCKLGKLTESEARQISDRVRQTAVDLEFIAKGDPEHDVFPTSRVDTIRLEEFNGSLQSENLDFLHAIAEFDKGRKNGAVFSENDPSFLLQEALRHAERLREMRGTRKRAIPHDPEKKARERRTWMERILGTMVHVLMTKCNISKEEAANKIKAVDGFKEEFKEYSFEPVKEIDDLTDMVLLAKKSGEPNLSTVASDILKAAVIAIQCCCNPKPMKTRELKKAFGEPAYSNASRLKNKLGFQVDRK